MEVFQDLNQEVDIKVLRTNIVEGMFELKTVRSEPTMRTLVLVPEFS